MSVFLYKKSLKINTIPKGERMQNSGLVRRIDELGRIVIPKEIRRTLRIRSGDAIEISKEGETLLLTKHSPFKEYGKLATQIVQTLSTTLKKECLVTDTDRIIYSSKRKDAQIGSLLTSFCNQVMEERKSRLFKSSMQKIPSLYLAEQVDEIKERFIVPIVKDGDCYGLMVISSLDQSITSEEYSLIDLSLKILTNNL